MLVMLAFSFGPPIVLGWLIFGKLANYIIINMFASGYHNVIGVFLTYFVLAIFGGTEVVLLMFWFGWTLGALVLNETAIL